MIIQIAIFFILANTVLGLFFFVTMIKIRKKNHQNDKRTVEVQSKAEDLFLAFLLSENLASTAEIFERYESDVEKFNKKSLLTVAMALENLILDNRALRQSINFMPILESFDLLNRLEDNIGSFSKKKRLNVFQTLSNLELTVSDSKILPHTYSKNTFIQKGSRTSYIAVSKNDPFKFFEKNRETELNDWDQISLLQQFEIHHKDNLPEFSQWIKYTQQKSQIIFFIRMTAHFNQTNSLNTITELLDHDDHDIRYESILALGKLNFYEIEEKLITMFFSQPELCQKAIVQSITLFQTGSAFEFLKNAYESAANTDIKLLLAESLYLYKPQGYEYFKSKIQKEEGFNKLILQHVENPLIKSELTEVMEQMASVA